MALSRLARLKAKIKAFDAVTTKYAEFGAADTEPDYVFQRLLAYAAWSQPLKLPTTGTAWSLYTSKKGVGAAARALATAARACVKVIEDTREDARGAIWEYLDEYCWRTSFRG